MREQQENFVNQSKEFSKHSKGIDKYINKIYELEEKQFKQTEIHKLLIEKHKKNKKMLKQKDNLHNSVLKTLKTPLSINKKYSH